MKRYMVFMFMALMSVAVRQQVRAAAAAEDVEEQQLLLNKNLLGEQLIKAVSDHNIARVRQLIEQGALIDCQDKWGNTPLYLAIFNYIDGDQEIIRMLLAAHANVNFVYQTGDTPLMAACIKGEPEAVQLLLDAGADIDVQNNQGRTALMLAAVRGESIIVQRLLLVGANPDIVDNAGETAWTLRPRASILRGQAITRERMTQIMVEALERRYRSFGVVERFLPVEGVTNLVTEGYVGVRRPTEAGSVEEKGEEEARGRYK